ncbi:MAG: hypothetical protein DI535_17325 [Citrobacter freundii]|nr:MAG: hypothetical protein DI535_17325 [Citrobacter freundii]
MQHNKIIDERLKRSPVEGVVKRKLLAKSIPFELQQDSHGNQTQDPDSDNRFTCTVARSRNFFFNLLKNLKKWIVKMNVA